MASPGKLDNSMWEKKTAAPPKPGDKAAAPGAGAKGKASFFEQAAKDAGPKEVQKKKTWKASGNTGGFSNEGKFKGKTQIGDGPPPKKNISDFL